LRVVEKGLQSIANKDNSVTSCSTKNIDKLKADKPLGIFKRNQFYFPELERINKCAYFDYQR